MPSTTVNMTESQRGRDALQSARYMLEVKMTIPGSTVTGILSAAFARKKRSADGGSQLRITLRSLSCHPPFTKSAPICFKFLAWLHITYNNRGTTLQVTVSVYKRLHITHLQTTL
jgi:hypothetical protein